MRRQGGGGKGGKADCRRPRRRESKMQEVELNGEEPQKGQSPEKLGSQRGPWE